jgi:hypothetical protein
MSTTANPSSSNRTITDRTTESVRTPYLIAYLVAVIGGFLASAALDFHDLGVQGPWFFVALLAVGCALSRAGVTPAAATAGSSEPGGVPVRSLALVRNPES